MPKIMQVGTCVLKNVGSQTQWSCFLAHLAFAYMCSFYRLWPVVKTLGLLVVCSGVACNITYTRLPSSHYCGGNIFPSCKTSVVQIVTCRPYVLWKSDNLLHVIWRAVMAPASSAKNGCTNWRFLMSKQKLCACTSTLSAVQCCSGIRLCSIWLKSLTL